jgi:hypothetical protein
MKRQSSTRSQQLVPTPERPIEDSGRNVLQHVNAQDLIGPTVRQPHTVRWAHEIHLRQIRIYIDVEVTRRWVEARPELNAALSQARRSEAKPRADRRGHDLKPPTIGSAERGSADVRFHFPLQASADVSEWSQVSLHDPRHAIVQSH